MSELGANNGSDLIVDFGHRRPKRTSASNTDTSTGGEVSSTNNTTAMSMDRQVSFSEDVTAHCFQYPSREEVSKRWHSNVDKYAFKQELARDVRSLRCLLSITPMQDLEKEALYDCVGLEALISSKVTRFSKEMRQGHARSIVEMQYYLSEEQLAACAASHSSQSRERAQKLAAGYSKILP